MKKFLIIILAFTSISSAKAQLPDEALLYQRKIQSYTKTKNAGSALLGGGLVTSAIGTFVMIKNLDGPSNTYGDYDDDISEATIGAYVIALGLDMIIGGIILQSVGHRKVKQYQQKLHNLSGGVMISPECHGLTLVYRF